MLFNFVFMCLFGDLQLKKLLLSELNRYFEHTAFAVEKKKTTLDFNTPSMNSIYRRKL